MFVTCLIKAVMLMTKSDVDVPSGSAFCVLLLILLVRVYKPLSSSSLHLTTRGWSCDVIQVDGSFPALLSKTSETPSSITNHMTHWSSVTKQTT